MEKSKSTTSVVCDAGPIIHLSELDSLHILNDFQTIFIPNSVYNEILKHAPLVPEIELKVVSEMSLRAWNYRNINSCYQKRSGEPPEGY